MKIKMKKNERHGKTKSVSLQNQNAIDSGGKMDCRLVSEDEPKTFQQEIEQRKAFITAQSIKNNRAMKAEKEENNSCNK